MPIYEYECGKCGHEFEREQRMSDDPVKTCPKCRARKVKRLISQTSFVLKGGGWYSDLYSSQKQGGKPDKEGSSESKSDSKSSDKSSDTSPDKSPDKPKKGGDKGKAKGQKSAA